MIAEDDPRDRDVRELLARHLELMRSQSPPEDVHALDIDGLLDPAVTFYSFRNSDGLLAVGAVKELDSAHGELKSMHTAAEARGRGIGRAMLTHLISVARLRGYTRLSLETGSLAAFAPARGLYEAAGFRPCGPFGNYTSSPNSTFMTLEVGLLELILGRDPPELVVVGVIPVMLHRIRRPRAVDEHPEQLAEDSAGLRVARLGHGLN